MNITELDESIYRVGWPYRAEVTYTPDGDSYRITAKTETAEWLLVDVTNANGGPLWQLIEDEDWAPCQREADGGISFTATYRYAPSFLRRMPL